MAELYRQTPLGDSLCEVLEEMVNEGKVTQELAVEVLKKFDQSIVEALARHVQGRCTIRADLKTYRYFDNVWQFTLEDVEVKLQPGAGSAGGSITLHCDCAKVVCVDGKLLETAAAGGAPPPQQ